MALPKLNQSPQYELEVPSTKQKIHFRPYLVKEEKVLMLAYESNSQNEQINAVINTIQACVQEELNVKSLPTFDVDYIFTKIRTKSVGETTKLKYSCGHCDYRENDVEVNLDSVVVDMPEVDNKVQITDDISVIIGYPTYMDMVQVDENIRGNGTGLVEIIARSIKQINTEEEAIQASDCKIEELVEFIDSMTSSQFEKISDFFESMPQVKINHSYTCTGCGQNNDIEIKGLENFFV